MINMYLIFKSIDYYNHILDNKYHIHIKDYNFFSLLSEKYRKELLNKLYKRR